MASSIRVLLRTDESADREILELVHLAFEERKTQGLNFTCINYTIDDIKKKAEGAFVFLAYDKNKLVGCIFFHVYPQKGNYGYIEVVSTHPDYKGMGIASILIARIFQKAKELGVIYIGSDTAVNANSSVKWHLKNGFAIIKLQSSTKSNYFSYVFRKQLKKPSIWNCSLWTKTHYIFSFIKCRMMRNQFGQYTAIGKLVKKVKKMFVF